MIKCVMTIKEVGKGFSVDIEPDQSKATPTEMRIAGFLNFAIEEAAQYLMSKGEKGEMIESKDAEAVREIIRKKTKEFEGI
jgi:hypothetical protein